jgi:hypothetical protein
VFWIAVTAAAAAALTHGLASQKLLAEHMRGYKRQTQVELAAMIGRPDILLMFNPINAATPAGSEVWLVGEARAFYVERDVHYFTVFNRDPWLAYAAQSTPEEAVEWLRTRGVTNLVFSWPEVVRLRETYGFPEFVTPVWVQGLLPYGLSRLDSQEPSTGYDVYRIEAR